MDVTVIGVIADKIGAALVTRRWGGRTRREALASPSLRFRRTQATPIPIRIDHGPPELGRLAYLELNDAQELVAVATVEVDDLGDQPWYWSPTVRWNEDGALDLIELSLTESPASVALRAVEIFDGNLRHVERLRAQTTRRTGDLLERAADAARREREVIEIRTDASTAPTGSASGVDRVYLYPRSGLVVEHWPPHADTILSVR